MIQRFHFIAVETYVPVMPRLCRYGLVETLKYMSTTTRPNYGHWSLTDHAHEFMKSNGIDYTFHWNHSWWWLGMRKKEDAHLVLLTLGHKHLYCTIDELADPKYYRSKYENSN